VIIINFAFTKKKKTNSKLRTHGLILAHLPYSFYYSEKEKAKAKAKPKPKPKKEKATRKNIK
jgi:hypothetical protein